MQTDIFTPDQNLQLLRNIDKQAQNYGNFQSIYQHFKETGYIASFLKIVKSIIEKEQQYLF